MSNEELKIYIVGECSNWNLRDVSQGQIPAEVRRRIEDSDIFIFNLEGPIAKEGSASNGPIKNGFVRFLLRCVNRLQPVVTSTEGIVDVLDLGKCKVACLANNHILDGGEESIRETMDVLGKRKFLYLGAGRDIREASRALTFEIKDKRIGILNYNFIGWRKWGLFVNVFGAGRRKAGANYSGKRRIKREVEYLAGEVDYTIAVFHIGRELKDKLSLEDVAFLESLKADVVVTHHAHIAQEIKSSKVVSCGDFIFNYPSHLPDERKSAVFEVVKGEIHKKAIRIVGGIPYLDEG